VHVASLPGLGPDGLDTSAVHRNTQLVVDAATALGLAIEPVTYPDGTRTAEDAARAIGCDVAQIVKSLVFDLVEGDELTPVMALVSGSNRLDEAKLVHTAHADGTRRADADRVRRVSGFPIGGVPPFGHPAPIRTFVDEDLLQHDEVWAAGGTPQTVFGVHPQALVDAIGATVVDLAE
jgi:prolyl-tRNA editing enzyme YbaK/EbsC (Cys-tRNA(Pro) deacylase)